jgi:multidrug resistance efflux pump
MIRDLQQFMIRFGPWVTFALTIALSVGFASSSRDIGRMIGFADGDPVAIAPMDASRVLTVAVEPGQDVVAGQIVAGMDTSAVDAELEIAEAKQAELDARVAAATAGGRNEEASRQGTLDETVDRARLALTEEEHAFGRAEAEAQALEADARRLTALLRDGLATRAELAAVEIERSAARRRADGKAATIDILREQLRAAVERRDHYVATSDSEIEPLRRQVEVLSRRVGWLRRQRSEAALRAPAGGRILEVVRRPGETVTAGGAVVTMVRAKVDRVVVCVSEQHSAAAREGASAELSSYGNPEQVARGRVISLGPSVTELPPRCQRSPMQRAFGRSVVVLLDQPLDAVPGESFDVRFLGTARGGDAGVAVAAMGGDGPTAIHVPGDLTDRFRFEPSGLVWQPDLLRYLVVSDDTGEVAETEHAPWLFAMSIDGKVDPQPVAVAGVRALNDLESIAMDTDGSIYVLSSQSHSKRGNRPSSRTAFLRLRRARQGYDVIGEIHLAEALEGADAAVRERLGLPSGQHVLEIEGLAVRAGTLYLGLKAPLDSEGRSSIWRLSNPRAAFDRGAIDLADLELWARVALTAESDGREVAGGISDLLFLPDGTLVIATTPAVAEATRESGRVFYVSDPQPGVLVPQAYRSFEGLRPEGLSVTPAPGRLAVVFDAGDAGPRWVELPWPG